MGENSKEIVPFLGGRPKLICVPVWRQKSRVAFFVSHP